MWNEKFSDTSYSVSSIPDYFDINIRKCEALTNNSLITSHINKIKSEITFKIKTSCYHFEHLISETIELL